MTRPRARFPNEQPVTIRPFVVSDLAEARKLWENVDGVSVTDADGEDAFAAFLRRNRRLSMVALQDGRIIGTILAGHDGRRGYLYHLAVIPEQRFAGVGRRLVASALQGLAEVGIRKCHLMAFADNEAGKAFWLRSGAARRDDLVVFSLPT